MAKLGTRTLSWVLALALVLAMAAPFATRAKSAHSIVAGSVVFTPTSLNVNAVAQWTVVYDPDVALAPGTGEITVAFPSGVVLPTAIAKTSVSVNGQQLRDDPQVTVATRTVILKVPGLTNGNVAIGVPSAEAVDAADALATVIFSQTALITNPAASGAAGVAAAASAGSVNATGEAAAVNAAAALVFARTLTFTPARAAEGGTVTVTGGGFTPGTSIVLSGGNLAGSGTVETNRTFGIAAVRSGAPGAGGDLTATDGAGLFTTITGPVLAPTLTVTATGKAGDTIALTGTNWVATAGAANDIVAADITFGGAALAAGNIITALGIELSDRDADGAADDFRITVRVPSGTTAGPKQISIANASNLTPATGSVDVTPRTVTLTPSSGPPSTVVTVTGAGFPASIAAAAGNTITGVPAFGAAAVTQQSTDSAGNLVPGAYTIPAGATTNVTLTVSITNPADGAATVGTAVFTRSARPLSASPTSGPRGTGVVVTGSGFTGGGEVDPNGVVANVAGVNGAFTIGGIAALAAGQGIGLDSAGNLPGTSVTVPAATAIGAATISATDNAALVGTATFTVTVPTITVSPTAGLVMGTPTTVTGAGWTPNSSVTVGITGRPTPLIVSTNSAGGFEVTSPLPAGLGIGPVAVTFTANDGALGNIAVPVTALTAPAAITLSAATVSAGANLTITGTGFVPGVGVAPITIGGAAVTPLTPIITNSTGGFQATVLVPGLAGVQLVNATVGGVVRTIAVNVQAAVVNVETQLQALIASNNLEVAWKWDKVDRRWKSFQPGAPAAANDLTVLAAGEAVAIVVKSAAQLTQPTFTENLVAGLNFFGWR